MIDRNDCEPPRESAPERHPDTVQSLARGLAVIRAFDAERPKLTLSEIARITGMTRAAARRFLLTLVSLGYVASEGRLFFLRPRILELGYAYLSSSGLPEIVEPHLEALASQVHESTSVSVLDGHEIVYVARVAARRIMTVMIGVGTRFPAYATSMGRVLLAGQSDDWLDGYLQSARLQPLTRHTISEASRLRSELRVIREQDWAFVEQELEEGLCAIAAPIRESSGRVIAAINVSANTLRGSAEEIREEILPHLVETAQHIERDLSHFNSGR